MASWMNGDSMLPMVEKGLRESRTQYGSSGQRDWAPREDSHPNVGEQNWYMTKPPPTMSQPTDMTYLDTKLARLRVSP